MRCANSLIAGYDGFGAGAIGVSFARLLFGEQSKTRLSLQALRRARRRERRRSHASVYDSITRAGQCLGTSTADEGQQAGSMPG